MKPLPIPKKELLAKNFDPTISITVASTDAQAFVEAECGQFGSLIKEGSGVYNLLPTALYNVEEITAWLNSYNDEISNQSPA